MTRIANDRLEAERLGVSRSTIATRRFNIRHAHPCLDCPKLVLPAKTRCRSCQAKVKTHCPNCGGTKHMAVPLCKRCVEAETQEAERATATAERSARQAQIAEDREIAAYGGIVAMAAARVREAVRDAVLAGITREPLLQAMRDGIQDAKDYDDGDAYGQSASSSAVVSGI